MDVEAIEQRSLRCQAHAQIASLYSTQSATKQAEMFQFEDRVGIGRPKRAELLKLAVGSVFEAFWLCEDKIDHTRTAGEGLFWFYSGVRQIGHVCFYQQGFILASAAVPVQEVLA